MQPLRITKQRPAEPTHQYRNRILDSIYRSSESHHNDRRLALLKLLRSLDS